MAADTTATTSAAADLRHALAGALRTYGRDRIELEFRLGHRMRGTFIPGVSEAGWRRLRSKLDACKKMTRQFAETREYLASTDQGDGKYVEPVRQPGEPGAGEPAPGAWMYKKRLHNIDADMSVGCCRASISLESAAEAAAGPPREAKFCRHKQRWSYRYKCWSVDVTSVNSNLPHQLDNDGVSYEVEIELVDTAILFTMPLEVLIEWGLRLAQDMAALAAPR